MSSRLAACESCRKSKLACDHQKPVCTRCKNSNRAGICVYRTAPFKRRRNQTSTPPTPHSPRSAPSVAERSISQRRHPYPNPGYLGSSSHVTIFNHLSMGDEDGFEAVQVDDHGENPLVRQGANLLRDLLDAFPLKDLQNLVRFWMARGVNLALAGCFVTGCVESMDCLLSVQEENWHLVCATYLLERSARPLLFGASSTIETFSGQFTHRNVRWETMGIFLSAVIRATIDVPFFPELYTTQKDQYKLRKLATGLSDCALDICISLDCLNDLQLIFQYENFIVHSYVHGDQSYHSWRKLGDAISSIFALGYHDNIQNKPDIPPFLIQLRKAAFARLNSADKNVAIFLGRPPRMTKRFCQFHLPLDSGQDMSLRDDEWSLDAKADYIAETRWSALCASLKEDILELYRDKHDVVGIAQTIQTKAIAQWNALPPHFRLNTHLKDSSFDPYERDFLASLRLNHLHVLLLLRLLLTSPADPDHAMISVAQEMLSLIVEAILLRDLLVNSGTGLIWKIAHYGLPAAGIILLSMLKQSNPSAKALQDLTVFAAEIRMGTVVTFNDPNYGLVSKAVRTIQSFLDSGLGGGNVGGNIGDMGDDWSAVINQEAWDSEGFWQNLAGHPLLNLDVDV